jgi:hypothetical protein
MFAVCGEARSSLVSVPVSSLSGAMAVLDLGALAALVSVAVVALFLVISRAAVFSGYF